MGRDLFVDGEWNFDREEMTDEDGEFHRSETSFRDWIRYEGDAEFRPEPNRYHLYISRACPWAHGAVLVRKLLGLEEEISVDIVDPYRERKGWQFTPEKENCTEDTVNGKDYLYQVYTEANENYTGRITVPVLWDREEDTIVNNESIEIMEMLCKTYDGDRDLYPEEKREEIDERVKRLYKHVNNGVYKAGFADTQKAYDKAVEKLFEELEHWNEVLEDQRYLVGDQLTLADLRFYATLIRFDEVYHTHFKCNRKLITEFDNLWPYLRDIYQTEGVKETVNMEQIKEHYYTTHDSVNPKGLVPVGPDPELEKPHSREKLSEG
jgi:putative glutathione S-transferase